MKYRAEIDGLRALAVAPVIFFHAGFELFGGGFVGVDVFFVISGYLITTILIEDIQAKRFNIINFYERRVRRILPALFFVMLTCIPFAWMSMLPGQMKDFSQSLVAVSLFVSNLLFWRESGYFDSVAKEKPLLHTWSLAVEEQYYVLFPIFLILAWPYGKNRVFWIIVVLAAISLLLSEWGWRKHPSANFYLSPTRAWELLSGSITAFIVQKNGVQKSNILAILGLTAIIFSIFAYDQATPFPSVYALVPVLGVVMLILYADKETLVAKLLSARVFVGIGLISYSAYLWHQPLFAFARIKLSEQRSEELMPILSVLSFLLAYFSWKYIEKPFRDTALISQNVIFRCLLFGILAFIAYSIASPKLTKNYLYGNWVTSQIESVERNNRFVWKRKNELRDVTFTDDMWKILIIGDSNSGDLINTLEYLIDEKQESLSSITTTSGCGAVYVSPNKYTQYVEQSKFELCQNADSIFSKRSKKLINDADVVIFASDWRDWHVTFLAESRHKLIEEFGNKFWWFGNKHIEFPSEQERIILQGNLAEAYPPKISKLTINQSMQTILEGFFVNPYDLLCVENQCGIWNSEGELLLYDGFHLSPQGAEHLALRFWTVLPHVLQIWLDRE